MVLGHVCKLEGCVQCSELNVWLHFFVVVYILFWLEHRGMTDTPTKIKPSVTSNEPIGETLLDLDHIWIWLCCTYVNSGDI